jgi:NADH-quinone oxidoreductase subunit H
VSTDLIIGVTKAALILGLLLTNTILLIWLERKLVAGMQSRVGPDRAGPFGILQTVADAVKLLLKEQILPLKADRAMYLLGSYSCIGTIILNIYDYSSWAKH